MYDSRYIEYAHRRRALNADGTADAWPHKYRFNSNWESCLGIPFRVHNIRLWVVHFWKRDWTTNKNQKILNYMKTFFYKSQQIILGILLLMYKQRNNAGQRGTDKSIAPNVGIIDASLNHELDVHVFNVSRNFSFSDRVPNMIVSVTHDYTCSSCSVLGHES